MNQMLAQWIYEGHSPDDLIRAFNWESGGVGALGIFVLGLVRTIPRDRARVRLLASWREWSYL